MCVWRCQHSVSNCCHLFHMSIPCCHWLSSIPSLHLLLMWCIYTQPPKKALDYVRDHSSGVSNEVKTNYSLFQMSLLGADTVILNRPCCNNSPQCLSCFGKIYLCIIVSYPASLLRHWSFQSCGWLFLKRRWRIIPAVNFRETIQHSPGVQECDS